MQCHRKEQVESGGNILQEQQGNQLVTLQTPVRRKKQANRWYLKKSSPVETGEH